MQFSDNFQVILGDFQMTLEHSQTIQCDSLDNPHEDSLAIHMPADSTIL